MSEGGMDTVRLPAHYHDMSDDEASQNDSITVLDHDAMDDVGREVEVVDLTSTPAGPKVSRKTVFRNGTEIETTPTLFRPSGLGPLKLTRDVGTMTPPIENSTSSKTGSLKCGYLSEEDPFARILRNLLVIINIIIYFGCLFKKKRTKENEKHPCGWQQPRQMSPWQVIAKNFQRPQSFGRPTRPRRFNPVKDSPKSDGILLPRQQQHQPQQPQQPHHHYRY
ncbi:hypothetical protein TCAL_07522 [Tigriopus californicus]|uniref:Uncharacterized protein n=1 Tax=Tigriopus californicus TaxID=6832 RepID=A0A553NZP6_TIGCA|nr:hypothetical protein TCAL_07522 [Tigriopus californicus]|eukprot:TCALIF_07522-PA protein Name:"Protein of unknown function" AED:0.28 eAED:0.66 QI:0/0/0/1/1/1/4/0/221